VTFRTFPFSTATELESRALTEGVDFALDDVPHDVEIDGQVAVNDSITKPSYVVPWDFWMCLLEGR